jgi:hypothetical protein
LSSKLRGSLTQEQFRLKARKNEKSVSVAIYFIMLFLKMAFWLLGVSFFFGKKETFEVIFKSEKVLVPEKILKKSSQATF